MVISETQPCRAEEETTARVKLEKENRELHSQLQETQDDLESEKEARTKADKLRKQLNEVCVCVLFSVSIFVSYDYKDGNPIYTGRGEEIVICGVL